MTMMYMLELSEKVFKIVPINMGGSEGRGWHAERGI